MTKDDDDRSMRERMEAGDLYITDEEILDLQREAQARMAAYNASPPDNSTKRRALLEKLLAEVGEDTELRPPVYVDYGTNIRVGARTFANFGLVALDVAAITIGDDVQIGPNVQLLTPTHPGDADQRRAKWEGAAPITIGNNVWLGGGAIILAGVTIGDDTIVGAGAVVTTDLPAGVVAVGNPAKIRD
jgi:maltose O-acetyltransferase